MLKVLKRLSLLFGIGLAALSVYFSWDGLDQTVTGTNPNYSELASVIGVILALVITLLQFIFNTDFASLNATLKFLGGLSYGYSIYTNKMGIAHIFGFDEFTSWMIAVFMDVLPEAFIAWSMGDSLKGDLLGNLFKWVIGSDDEKPQSFNRPPNNAPGTNRPNFPYQKPKNKGNQQNPIFHSLGKKNLDDTQPKINRGGFE